MSSLRLSVRNPPLNTSKERTEKARLTATMKRRALKRKIKASKITVVSSSGTPPEPES
ncbi:hypothetical protein ACVWZR_002414 [Bradyrhizobium sp. i1.3.1]